MSQDLMVMVAIGLYLAVCLYLGFRGATKIKTLKEFALGYKSIPTNMLVATLYATHLGGGATIGVIERIMKFGMVYAVSTLFFPVPWLISRYIFAKGISKFKNHLTSADILYTVYGKIGYVFGNIISIVNGTIITSIQFILLANILQYFFGIEYMTAVMVGMIIIGTYSVCGGVKAVITTDALQALLFCSIIPIITLLCVSKFGGITNVLHNITPDKYGIPTDFKSFITIGFLIFWSVIIPTVEEPPFLQRFLISGSPSQLYRALTSVACIDFVVTMMISIIGLCLLSSNEVMDQSQIFSLIKNEMPPIVIGMTIICLLAVLMSTSDSWINTTAILLSRALSSRVQLSDAKQVLYARLSTILVCIAGSAIAISKGSILEVLFVFLSIKPISLTVVMAAFLDYKVNGKDLVRMLVISIPSVALFRHLEGEFGLLTSARSLCVSILSLFGRLIISNLKYSVVLHNIFGPIKSLFKLINTRKAQDVGLYLFIFSIFSVIIHFYNSDIPHTICIMFFAMSVVLSFTSLYDSNTFRTTFKFAWLRKLELNDLSALCLLSGHLYQVIIDTSLTNISSLLVTLYLFYIGRFSWFVLLIAAFNGWIFSLYMIDEIKGNIQLDYGFLTFVCFSFLTITFATIIYFKNRKITSKDTIATIISHEMRNHLNTLRFAIDDLEVKVNNQNTDGVQSLVCSIKDTLKNTVNVINGVLTSGDQDRTSRYKLQNVVQEAVRTGPFNIEEMQKIKIIGSGGYAYINQYALIVILHNIIRNALSHSESDIVEVVISDHKISVIDYGKGINQIVQDKMWERGFSGAGGSGLGLYYARIAAEENGMTIDCESSFGRTEFTINILLVNNRSVVNQV